MSWDDAVLHVVGQISEWFVSGFMFTFGGFMAIALLVPLFTSSDKGKKVWDGWVLVDKGTGCQYLMTRKGGLTPRLDTHGRQICETGKEGQP